ncbi:MAG: hypothetical protein GY860_20710 [Desulfobacteraceae bacterium]|nr:hypothetical protein [Desulfobacteraceae bacterium]
MTKLFYFISIFLFFGITGSAIGFAGTKQIATGEAYFDVATGHRYIKNSETTYAEYSQKGKLLRTDVPNTQPHLSTSKYITKIDRGYYMVYEKKQNQMIVQQILPVANGHPKGWRCKQLLSAEGYETD